jgi:hypothetical protein
MSSIIMAILDLLMGSSAANALEKLFRPRMLPDKTAALFIKKSLLSIPILFFAM